MRSLRLCAFASILLATAMTKRVDPNSQEEFWETIKDTRTVLNVTRDEQNAVNRPDGDGKWLKVVAISDTHDQLGEMIKLFPIPEGDVLIHSGDFTNAGEREKLEAFNEQIGSLPHKHKIVVAGNHDLGFDDTEDLSKRHSRYLQEGTPKGYELLTNAQWLHDKAIVIDGVKFYGSSWHPLAGYPFAVERGPAMAAHWDDVPEDVDVLITHGPPLGYLDTFGEERWGDYDLLRAVEQKKPKFHVFGHIHERYGAASNGQTTFINAASCQKANKLNNKPVVFYIKART